MWKTPLEAIADPIRLRLVRALARRGPGTLAELAERAQVHPNTARSHLGELTDAGLVESAAEAAGAVPGRPAKTYRLRPGWEPPETDFRGLAELLAGALADTGVKPRKLRSVGSDWGRYLSGRPRRISPAEAVPPVLARLGFDAHVQGERVVLSGCPCTLISPDEPALVCELARGAVEGVLAASGDVRVASAAHRPAERRCEIQLKRGG